MQFLINLLGGIGLTICLIIGGMFFWIFDSSYQQRDSDED